MVFSFKLKMITILKYVEIFYKKRYFRLDKILFIHFFLKLYNTLLQQNLKNQWEN